MEKKYTPWRQFLAWVGLLTLIAFVGLVAFLLIGDIESICLRQV